MTTHRAAVCDSWSPSAAQTGAGSSSWPPSPASTEDASSPSSRRRGSRTRSPPPRADSFSLPSCRQTAPASRCDGCASYTSTPCRHPTTMSASTNAFNVAYIYCIYAAPTRATSCRRGTIHRCIDISRYFSHDTYRDIIFYNHNFFFLDFCNSYFFFATTIFI